MNGLTTSADRFNKEIIHQVGKQDFYFITSAEYWKIFTEILTSNELLIPKTLRGMFIILYVLR
jgi:hypothetical protein